MFGKFGGLELVVLLIIVLLVFGGRGKISAIMGDVGSGLKAFKKSVKDEETTKTEATTEVAEEKETINTKES